MIISFSGTGNSFFVATLLSGCLHEDGFIRLQGLRLLEEEPVLDLSGHSHLIWVFPTYSWGIPPVVFDYIRRVRIINGEKSPHHLVTTCGDDVGNLIGQWYILLKQKGWLRAGSWSVQMPNTYVLMKGFDTDPEVLERKKLEACSQRVAHIAECIMNGCYETDVETGSWKRIKTSVIYPWFIRHEMSPKPFFADDRCISCGLCEQQCPTQNIVMRPANDPSARPQWGARCTLCLRCYHHCPANAIGYGSKTKGKGHYKILKFIDIPRFGTLFTVK